MGNQCQRTIRADHDRYAAGEAPTCAVPDGVARTCGPVGNLFLEPQGQVTTETWHYVGEGKGTYAKMQQYGFVGQGNGLYDRELTQTDYAGNGRKLCLFSIAALLMGGLAYAIVAPSLRPAIGRFTQRLSAPGADGFGGRGHRDGELVLTTLPPEAAQAPSEFLAHTTSGAAAVIPWQQEVPTTVAPSPPPPASSTSTSTTRPPQHFVCAVGPEAIKAAEAVEALWRRADADGSAGLSREELQGASAVLSARTQSLLLDGDVDGDGHLSHDEFAAALRLADEADRNGTTAVAMDAAIASWPEDKRVWCCAHAGAGCPTPAPAVLAAAPATNLGVAGGQPTAALPTVAPTAAATPATTGAAAALTVAQAAAAAAAAPLQAPHSLPALASTTAAAAAVVVDAPPGRGAAGASAGVEASTATPAAAAAPVAGESTDPYDCTGTDEKSWSKGQQDWCCRHKRKGCDQE